MNRTKSASFLAAALLACGSSFGQNAVTFLAPVDTLVGYTDVPADDELSLHLDVENTGEDTLVLMATRLFVDTVSPFNYPYATGAVGAYDRFCWGPLCYNFGTDASSTTNPALLVTLAPGEVNTTLVTDYYYNGVLGTSTLRYCLHEVGQAPEAGACHDVTYQVESALAVSEASAVPTLQRVADDRWQYAFADASHGLVRVVDLMGREVHQQLLAAPSGQIQFPTATLPAATYVVVLESASGLRTTEATYFRGR